MNKENTNQIRPISCAEISHAQGSQTNSLELKVHAMGDSSSNYSSSEEEGGFEDIDPGKYGRLKSLIEEPSELELKPLPKHLEYPFLAEGSKHPVIITSDLTAKQKGKLLSVLKKYKREITWKISDIREISPSFCTHKILMEDIHRPTVIPQQRLNPNMKKVV